MNIENTVSKLRDLWKNLNTESIKQIKSMVQNLSQDQKFQTQLLASHQDISKGVELYRDTTYGFVLIAYSEGKGLYRTPHDHGGAWVIYVVVSGELEMGNYFKSTHPDGDFQLILKNQELLKSGDLRIYYPGEIHDTRCISEQAIILRLTSLDLREEERAGRMQRYKK